VAASFSRSRWRDRPSRISFAGGLGATASWTQLECRSQNRGGPPIGPHWSVSVAAASIYTAMLGMFLGTAIASSQYHALIGLAILVVAYLRKTRLEEQILRETFGADYDAYCRDTWALVPLLF
jgi:Na+/glutamate symporter